VIHTGHWPSQSLFLIDHGEASALQAAWSTHMNTLTRAAVCPYSCVHILALQADIVKMITFVDGTGQVTTVNRESLVGRGLAGGLGMLGVITEITLQLQPGLGKTRSWRHSG
jgi:hypothetical protein